MPNLIKTKDASKRMHGGALASLVDLVGSAVFFAGGSPTTGVSLEITISYLTAARANVSRRDNELKIVHPYLVDFIYQSELFTRVVCSNNNACPVALWVQEEIEIDARVLGIGATAGCVTVEVRKKATGEVIAHGRHTKYLAVSSKL